MLQRHSATRLHPFGDRYIALKVLPGGPMMGMRRHRSSVRRILHIPIDHTTHDALEIFYAR
jgi:hypothetical protein